jgi:hypothetical protein
MLTGQDFPDYQVSAHSKEMYGDDWDYKVHEVFQNPRATRAVFVRDPMIRFVSAFMSKCLGKNGPRNEFCPMLKPGIVFRDAVEWALDKNVSGDDMQQWDPHWRPQAFHCALQHRLTDYTVIGHMSATSLSQDGSCLLSRANLSQYDIFQSALANENHVTGQMGTEEDILKRMFTPGAARKLIERYRIDYDTLGFPREPAWIDHAIGDWYEKIPEPQSSRYREFPEVEEGDDSIDSIVTEAYLQGYV